MEPQTFEAVDVETTSTETEIESVEAIGQKKSSPLPVLQDTTRTAFGQTYTFRSLAEAVGLGEDNLRKRYWGKVVAAYQYCPYSLVSIASYDSSNQPVYRPNENALIVLRAYVAAQDKDAFLNQVRAAYPAPIKEMEPLDVETASPEIVQAPELPQTFSLARSTGSQIRRIDNPMQLAMQIKAAAQQVRDVMQQDLQQKEAELEEAQMAVQEIEATVQEITLDVRLYSLEDKLVGKLQNQTTDKFQNLLSQYQRLGDVQQGELPPQS